MSKVRIEMGEGPAICGNTKIFVDGVDLSSFVSSARLELKAGDVARLTLEGFAEANIEGQADVKRVVICPECRSEMEKALKPGNAATVETTCLADTWVRRAVVTVKDEDGKILDV